MKKVFNIFRINFALDEAEDKIKDLLDTLDIKIYEKNYEKCWEYYNILFDMRKSKVYMEFL